MSSETPYVTLFADSSFDGNALSIPPQVTNIPNLADYGFANITSSIQIGNPTPGYVILTVYTGTNYTGYGYVFRGPQSVLNLEDFGINDVIQSLTINVNLTTVLPGITLYQDTTGGAKSFYCGVGSYPNLSELPIGNGTVQSINLFGNTKVVLYQLENYGSNLVQHSTTYSNSNSYPTFIQVSVPKKAESMIVSSL